MNEAEQAVVHVLSLFQQPIHTAALLVGARLPQHKILDAIEELVQDALVERTFDANQHDFTYSLLPIARSFGHSVVAQKGNLEERIRRDLTDWYEATDILEPDLRKITREVRQGIASEPEAAMLDIAISADKRGDWKSAEDLYEKALEMNPQSWKAAKQFAEFCRHKKQNTMKAMQLYERAAANAPNRGQERALIFREWGMLLRDSGDPTATEQAIEKFRIALNETPNDIVAIHAYAHMLFRKGNYRQVVEFLEPLANHQYATTRRKTYPLLVEAYTNVGEIVKAAELRQRIEHEEY